MTVIHDQTPHETLWMETDWCQEYRYSEQIMIAFNKAEHEGDKPYLSIVLYGMYKEKDSPPMWGQIFPNMEEVDIIIKALQEAKVKALEKAGTDN